jgi:molybdenum-dependent DNA-binding transcriptional regulator ModE
VKRAHQRDPDEMPTNREALTPHLACADNCDKSLEGENGVGMLELGLLRALHAVSTNGSINAAAEALHITNSAVSQRLAKLERDVGQVMLERHGRGVRLTDAARLLVDHAEQILSLVDAAEARWKDTGARSSAK